MIAPFCYGFEGNYVSLKGAEGLNPIQTLFGASCLGVILTLPMVWISDEWVNPNTTWGKAEWALLAVILLHIAAYAGYLGMVRSAGSVFASQVAYIVTITGVLWSIALLAEGYSIWIWASLGCLLVGMSMVLPNPKFDTGSEEL
jgi:drug/metabolite transporter (DMT)-like permease